ncbi:MAG: hypothetical protein KC502_02500 [Myxococcales bacterium]|nr:hypothetical protein [Myxococcales bacterium]
MKKQRHKPTARPTTARAALICSLCISLVGAVVVLLPGVGHAVTPAVARHHQRAPQHKLSLSADLRRPKTAHKTTPDKLKKGSWTLKKSIDIDSERVRKLLAQQSVARRALIKVLEAVVARHGTLAAAPTPWIVAPARKPQRQGRPNTGQSPRTPSLFGSKALQR